MARQVTISLILLVLVGCSKANPEMAAMPPPVVSVSYPLEQMVTDSNTFTGRTTAVESIIVRARVCGATFRRSTSTRVTR